MGGTRNKDQTWASTLCCSPKEEWEEKDRKLCGCDVVHLKSGWWK